MTNILGTTSEDAIFRDLDEADLAFFQACERFDWHYDASDDNSVWRRGMERKQELQRMKADSPVREAIWQAWHEYNFSGRPWGTERAPRPALDAGFAETD